MTEGWRRYACWLSVLVALATPGSACTETTGGPSERTITVFAAASLTETFAEIGKAFEAEHEGARVAFSFGASSALATQISEGAPADVFAAADTATMERVSGRAGTPGPRVFATNALVVVVPRRAGGLTTFADLADPGTRLVLAARDVPIGKYAREVLAKASGEGGIASDFAARVLANLKSEETNTRAVLSKVQLGEADAGIVYRTDVAAAAGDVTVIEIPAAYNVTAEYLVAALAGAEHPDLAAGFVEYLLSPGAQATLVARGFGGVSGATGAR
ncbi:MAG: molybdate ABC transporter substrate-binding protein [Dehalococcoidia bacterium]